MNDRPRALTVLICIFLAGCIIGALAFFLWARRSLEFSRFHGRPEGFGFARRGGPGPQGPWLPQLLNLTPDQNRRYMEAMSEFRKKLDSLRQEQERTDRYKTLMDEFRQLRTEQEPKVREIESEMNRKITEILDQDQRQKFLKWLKDFEDRRMRGPRREWFGPPEPPNSNERPNVGGPPGPR